MYKSLTKIVLTGGPCGGKTSGLARISRELADKGYKVIVIPEAATAIKSAGIKIGEGEFDAYNFEEMIVKMQLFNEEMYKDYAQLLLSKDVIIVCDRGVTDVKAYVSEKQYKDLLEFFALNEVEVRDSYSAVFHLKTVADGKEEFYTCDNNMAREDTPEEARQQDLRTLNAWTGHPHLRVIDNSTGFDEKIDRLMAEIYSFLGLPIPIENERKYLINMPSAEQLLSKYKAVKSEIIQVYLIPQNENEEVRIRQRGQDGAYSYYLTKKIKKDDMSRYEIEEKISKEEYLGLLMNADTSKSIIRKNRYCFIYENQYFELDIYPFCKDKAILEIELTDENSEISIPADICVIKEVTNDDRFKNASIAENREILTDN